MTCVTCLLLLPCIVYWPMTRTLTGASPPQVKSEALWILGRYRQERLDQTFDTDTVRRQGSLEMADF